MDAFGYVFGSLFLVFIGVAIYFAIIKKFFVSDVPYNVKKKIKETGSDKPIVDSEKINVEKDLKESELEKDAYMFKYNI